MIHDLGFGIYGNNKSIVFWLKNRIKGGFFSWQAKGIPFFR